MKIYVLFSVGGGGGGGGGEDKTGCFTPCILYIRDNY